MTTLLRIMEQNKFAAALVYLSHALLVAFLTMRDNRMSFTMMGRLFRAKPTYKAEMIERCASGKPAPADIAEMRAFERANRLKEGTARLVLCEAFMAAIETGRLSASALNTLYADDNDETYSRLFPGFNWRTEDAGRAAPRQPAPAS